MHPSNCPIICFGELLWDMLPQGKQAGGAPMNVAFHLNRLNRKAFPFTAVGRDDLGRELIEFLLSKHIPNQFIQENDQPTGKVLVTLNEKNEATYTIESPSAWDFIEVRDRDIQWFRQEAPILVFGSLACRHAVSQQSLNTLLSYTGLKICDINLRPPFYNRELIVGLLGLADWIKINNDELNLISAWFDVKADHEMDQAQMIFNQFPKVSLLLVTRGDRGAACYDREGNRYSHPGFKVSVADTIGSGDSFLAMFISQYLGGLTIEQSLEQACAMGAVVASHPGATALFDAAQEISRLIKSTF